MASSVCTFPTNDIREKSTSSTCKRKSRFHFLKKRGPLGAIWIAAHHDVAKKLTKLQILNTDIVKTAGQIENPETEMSLRLSSHLLAGLSKIYTKKVHFLFTDSNDALSKITLAFRPSNVDLGPVNKAQIRSITIDEASTVHMDLDLDIDLENATWLTSQLSNQTSAIEITLPETGPRKRQSANRWADEEDVLVGSSWGAGENPLDLLFDDAEVPRFDQISDSPEKHRSSEAVQPERLGKTADESNLMEEAEMPMFEADVADSAGRPSEAPSSLFLTPGKSLDGSVLKFDDLQPISVRKAVKQQAKKKKPMSMINQNTELSRDEMQRWIKDPEALAAIVRQPKSLPLTTESLQQSSHAELARKGKLAEHMMSHPFVRFAGARLQALLEDAEGERARKKRKKIDESELTALHTSLGDDATAVAENFPVLEFEPPELDGDAVHPGLNDEGPDGQHGHVMAGRPSDVDVENGLENGLGEREEAEEEEAGGVSVEQQERTKKVVLMLQKHFKKAGAAKALPLSTMISSEASGPPSRHMAAAAFFECLGLCAKGMVELSQKKPYGEILIGSTPALAKFRVK